MFSKTIFCTDLHSGEKNPVQEEPDENVDQVKYESIPLEQVVDWQGCNGAQDEAFGKRLQNYGERDHSNAKLCPSKKWRWKLPIYLIEILFSFLFILIN